MNFSPAILSNIFCNLPLHDLHCAGQVSRSWQQGAKREYLKRKGIQPCLFVPEQLEFCKFLSNKNHATLLFYNERDEEGDLGNHPVNFIESQHWAEKNTIIKIPVHKVMMNTMEVNTFEMHAIRGIMGLYLPNDQRVQFYSEKSIKEFLGPPKEKATFMLFGQFDTDFLNEIKLRCRKKGGNSTLWGGNFFHRMTVDRNTTKLVGIRLTDVESWSVILNYNWNKVQFDQKLLKLYDQVKGKRNTIGLLCGKILFKKPSQKKYTNVKEIMKKIKMIFKQLPVIGAFSQNASTYYYGVDSITNDGVKEIKSANILSLVIISFG